MFLDAESYALGRRKQCSWTLKAMLLDAESYDLGCREQYSLMVRMVEVDKTLFEGNHIPVRIGIWFPLIMKRNKKYRHLNRSHILLL